MKDRNGARSPLSSSMLQPVHLCVGHGHARAARPLLGKAEISFDVKQIVLYAREHAVERRLIAEVEPHDADHRIDLV
jgi:hypothetical protein